MHMVEYGWSKKIATEYIIEEFREVYIEAPSGIGGLPEPSPWGENAVRIIEENRYNEPAVWNTPTPQWIVP